MTITTIITRRCSHRPDSWTEDLFFFCFVFVFLFLFCFLGVRNLPRSSLVFGMCVAPYHLFASLLYDGGPFVRSLMGTINPVPPPTPCWIEFSRSYSHLWITSHSPGTNSSCSPESVNGSYLFYPIFYILYTILYLSIDGQPNESYLLYLNFIILYTYSLLYHY